jgi:hypothetical protein
VRIFGFKFPTFGHTRMRGFFSRLDSPDTKLKIAKFAPEGYEPLERTHNQAIMLPSEHVPEPLANSPQMSWG